MLLWCNNTGSWWPEIPVILAIFVATVIMGTVCLDVYKKEKRSAKWRGGAFAGGERASNKLSTRVFWQSFWYLMAFYLTWPPYLALQYSWSSNNYFTNYGLILTAGMLVPLQGFWNFWVYIRPRQVKKASAYVRNRGSAFFSRNTHSTEGSSLAKTDNIRKERASVVANKRSSVDGATTVVPSPDDKNQQTTADETSQEPPAADDKNADPVEDIILSISSM